MTVRWKTSAGTTASDDRRYGCWRVVWSWLAIRHVRSHVFSMRKANDREKKRVGPLLGL